MLALLGHAQTIQKRSSKQNQKLNSSFSEIQTDGYVTDISAKVIYNAVPDGYHISFTKSYIASSNEEVERRLESNMNLLGKDLKKDGVEKNEILIDVITLDPLFDTAISDSGSVHPSGYKLTQNITIHAESIDELRPIVNTCLKHDVFDITNVKAYIKDTDELYDSLKTKCIEVINHKKSLCQDLGVSLSGGNTSFGSYKQVIYPSERYLKSYVQSSQLYKHHISQNSDINFHRELDVDNYYNLDLKSADFIFNSHITLPVIQVYYQIDFTYTKKNLDAITKAKEERVAEKNKERVYFIINDNGELEKLELKGARRRKN